MGGINCCLTVILCIALACEVYFINEGYEWTETNGTNEDIELVKFVILLRILADALTAFSYLVTWLNQSVIEAYLLSAPVTFIAFSIVVSIYYFCYPYVFEIAEQDLTNDCSAAAEYPPCHIP